MSLTSSGGNMAKHAPYILICMLAVLAYFSLSCVKEPSNENVLDYENERQLSNDGIDWYKRKEYEKALDCFKKLIDLHGSNYARYNYASTLSLLLKTGKYEMCQEHVEDILSNLQRILQSDPVIKTSVAQDKNFDVLKKFFGFHSTVGFDEGNQNIVSVILTSVDWGADDQGRIGSAYTLKFRKDSSMAFTYLDFTSDDYKAVTIHGNYTVKRNEVAITLKEPFRDSAEMKGLLSREGLSISSGKEFTKLFKDKIFRCDH